MTESRRIGAAAACRSDRWRSPPLSCSQPSCRPRGRRRRRTSRGPQGAAARRGRGPVRAAHPARRHRDRRHRRARLRARRRRDREATASPSVQRVGRPGVRDRGPRTGPSGQAGRPRDRPRRPLRAARLRRHARPHRRRGAGRRPPSTSSSSGWATASPPSAIPAAATASTGCWTSRSAERAQRDHRAAHRALRLLRPDRETPITTPEEARAWVRERGGARGATASSSSATAPTSWRRPSTRRRSRACAPPATTPSSTWRGSTCSTTARWGLTTMEHWYGLPEALFDDRTVQDYPLDYNYNDEQHRFGQAGRLWKQAAPPRQRAVERGDRRADRARLHHRTRPSPSTRPAAT